MNSRSRKSHLSTAFLVLLALAAGGLSFLALTQHSSSALIALPPGPTAVGTFTPPPSPSPTVTESQLSSSPQSTPDDTQRAVPGISVVIVGDSNSFDDSSDTWIETVAEKLGWAPVENLSSQGRGYIAKPSTCNISVCSNFEGTLPAVVEKNPDVVVTFGGMADGDQDLTDAAGSYFAALREALPQAELIAVSPVTSEDEVPYFLRLHDETIREAVEAAGGTFIDVGRPGVGDGEQFSAAAQDEIAQTIIAELS